jgi:REP-associated tyrosine transposase
MSRGNRKGQIFQDDIDRRLFLEVLTKTAERYDVRCYEYSLMGNHYHLVLDTPRGNLADAMRQLNGVFTQATNRRHKLTGHLFEGRYRSLVVDREGYLRRSCRYVALNAVRRGLVRGPAAWPWCSYRATAGLEPAPTFLHSEWIQWAFKTTSLPEAQRRYRLFVNDPVERRQRLKVDPIALGPLSMERTLREILRADEPERPVPREVRALDRPALEAVFGSSPHSRAARDDAIHVAHIKYGYRLSEIAAHLGLDPSTPSAILRRRAKAHE